MERSEFLSKFKARLLSLCGPTFSGGESVAEYADRAGPTYWDEPDMRADGPEECADSDFGAMEFDAP